MKQNKNKKPCGVQKAVEENTEAIRDVGGVLAVIANELLECRPEPILFSDVCNTEETAEGHDERVREASTDDMINALESAFTAHDKWCDKDDDYCRAPAASTCNRCRAEYIVNELLGKNSVPDAKAHAIASMIVDLMERRREV